MAIVIHLIGVAMAEKAGQGGGDAFSSPPRWKLFFLFILVSLVTVWFYRHLYLYVSQVLLIGGSLSVVALWKMVKSWWETEVGDERTLVKALSSPSGTENLSLAFLGLIVLWAVTSSVYLEYEGAPRGEVEYEVEVLMDGNPYMDTQRVTSYARVTGEPRLFAWKIRRLEFRIANRPEYGPLTRTARFWSAVRVKVPRDFRKREFRLLRIIPGAGVHNLLPDSSAIPETLYRLSVRHGDRSWRIDDLRRGVVYAGAAKEDLDWLVGPPEQELRERLIDDYLARIGAAVEAREHVIRALRPSHQVPTDEFAAGDTVLVEVGAVGQDPLTTHEVVLDTAGIYTVFLEVSR